MEISSFIKFNVTDSYSANQVLGALDQEVRELIRQSLETLDGQYEPESTQLKDGTEVRSMYLIDGDVHIHLTLPDGCVCVRLLSSTEWYSDDLIQLLECLTTD